MRRQPPQACSGGHRVWELDKAGCGNGVRLQGVAAGSGVMLDTSGDRIQMDELSQRIVDTAISLAEQGGFQAVRLRDVAAQADVALGTLYRRFRSKEDILVAALELEVELVERRMYETPIQGETPLDRVSMFFRMVTQGLCRRPNFAKAMLRAVSSGEPEIMGKVMVFHRRVTELITSALRGTPPLSPTAVDEQPTEIEHTIGFILQQIWFAALVGWMGGIRDQDDVIEQVRVTAELLLRGVQES